MDTVSVSEQTLHTDQYGNRSHYQVTFTRKRANTTQQRMERIELEIRCDGIERLRVEMPGEVGAALFYAVMQANSKFDIEAMAGRKVSL